MTPSRYQAFWNLFYIDDNQPQPSPILLVRKQVYIIPSKAGFFFGLVLLVMLLGAMNYNNSMGYALSFLLASLTLTSTFHTQRTLLGLKVSLGKVVPVFAGENAHFQLWIDNRSQAAKHSLFWRHENTYPHTTDISISIPTDQQLTLTIPVPTSQRGRIALGKLRIYTHFPLGLFYAWSYIHLDTTTLVYPRPLGHPILPGGHQSENAGEGYPVESKGDDFMGYRDYQLGDSPRHVDWKAVARAQPWLIKQFGGLEISTVWLDWEQVKHLNSIEAALSQLCLWILIAEGQGALYGLTLPDQHFEPDIGERHRERCLQALALFGQNP